MSAALDAMLATMNERATTPVPVGEPLIPDGPAATTADIQDFKNVLCSMGYEVSFGEERARTIHRERLVELTGRCTVGLLADEFLHAWNNTHDRRGRYLTDTPTAQEHWQLGLMRRCSGSASDRRFHQLELQNYLAFLGRTTPVIPGFVWRAFRQLRHK